MKEMYNIGQRVVVNISEFVRGMEVIDKRLTGATGIISKVTNSIFPYSIQFDDEELNELMKEYPRQFENIELIKIQ